VILTRQPLDLPLEGLEDVPSRRGYVVGEPSREAVNMTALALLTNAGSDSCNLGDVEAGKQWISKV
jgi:hypothetical protein